MTADPGFENHIYTPMCSHIPAQPSDRRDLVASFQPGAPATEEESLWASLSRPTTSYWGHSDATAHPGLHLCAHSGGHPYTRTAVLAPTGETWVHPPSQGRWRPRESHFGRPYPAQPNKIGGSHM